MKSRFLLAALCLMFLAGCVTFETQTLTYRHDAKHDRLLIFQEYVNIHSDGMAGEGQGGRLFPSNAPPPEIRVHLRDCEELDSVLHTPRTFFFDNWLTEYNQKGIAEGIGDLTAKLATASPEEAKLLRAGIDFCVLLTNSVTVTHGPFRLDADGRLCLFQYVTVSNVSKLLRAGNALASDVYLHESNALTNLPAADREKARAFAGKRDWIRLRGNEATVRFPVPPAGSSEAMAACTNFLFSPPTLTATYTEPLYTLTFGSRGDAPQAISITHAPDHPQISMIEHVRAHYEIAGSLDIGRIKADFLKAGRCGPVLVTKP